MATIVDNRTPVVRSEGPGTGFVVALILLILLAVLFFAYGLPGLRGNNNTTNSTGGSAELNTPAGNMDVNVEKTQ